MFDKNLLYTHYSKNKIEEIRNVTQDQNYYGPKPKGLWFSRDDIDDSWREWCEVENFVDCKKQYKHEIKFKEDANILVISTYEELEAFELEYGYNTLLPDGTTLRGGYYQIRWPEVAEKYDGIAIFPYIYEARLRKMWYYGWDVASGCVWKASAIESITHVDS